MREGSLIETPLLRCPFCGNAPICGRDCTNGMPTAETPWLFSCPNANCPASVIHTSQDSWNVRSRHAVDAPVLIEKLDALKSPITQGCGDSKRFRNPAIEEVISIIRDHYATKALSETQTDGDEE